VNDPRVDRLAELIAGYSLSLREGDVVRIDGSPVAAPLLVALYRAALERGANAYLNVSLDDLAEVLVETGSGEQLDWVSPVEHHELDLVDAIATVWADENTRALSSVDPERYTRLMGARRPLRERRWARIAAGDLRWAGLLFPTHAHAQDAEMSLDEYEDFVYRACHCDGNGDAEAHWRATAEGLESHASRLAGTRELRVVGPDTDLRIGVEGRTWLPAEGRLNMPDGEVFTSPVETAVDGEIRFQFPAIYEGREVDDVRLRFADGRVVESEAASGGDYLRALLDTDEGARILGEVAFGLNYEIDRFTRNILFDEKIGGTMHFAVGSGFAQAGGGNASAIHWDMICDLREDGEVYADGELVWRAGRFLEDGRG
jgi:aminopeptidase